MKYSKGLPLVILGAVALFFAGVYILNVRKDKTITAPQETQTASSPETAAGSDAPAPGGQAWMKRCQDKKAAKDDKPHCEVFQRLVVAKTGQRLMEVAVGFPEGRTDAMGIFILPLGILLDPGVIMKIDDSPAYRFDPRYCDKEGCFGYVDLKGDLLDRMRKGNKMSVLFRTAVGKAINIEIDLKGFAQAIKEAAG